VLRSRRFLATVSLAALLAAAAGLFVAWTQRSGGISKPDAPGIHAAFTQRSYAPGARVRLRILDPRRRMTIRFFRVGLERRRALRNDVMAGTPVTAPRTLSGSEPLTRLGAWPSGLYFARLSGGGLVGYAPFVVRPRRLGEHRVLIVLPTNTWQAYNFRDLDGNGVGDTWYASDSVHTVDLTRPFLDRGVPPHYRGYDQAFLEWLARTGRRADFVSDDDFERVGSGDELARAYDLVAFPGHEEYVTAHAYDVAERYRDLGGNLAFLAANNFFYKVERHGDMLHGRTRWRDLGRPEVRLIGAQYVDWNHDKYANRPYVVTSTAATPWLFRGSGLRDGTAFGRYGIEIDARTGDSPPGTQVLARIPNVFGRGKTAEMTYYETPRGARVFAAGAMNFGGSAHNPVVARLLANLWARLARP